MVNVAMPTVVLVVHLLHAATMAAPSNESTADCRAPSATNRLHETGLHETGLHETELYDVVTTELSNAAASAIEDIAISADGSVHGRVDVGSAAQRSTGLRVKFVRGQRAVAIAAIDREGRFTVRNLSAGLYRVVVEGPDVSDWRFFRLWYAEAAPPSARGKIVSLTAKPFTARIVRGQHSSPFPIMSLRQAAAVTGIAAGAIAAPLIYHNARASNRVPISN